MDREVLCESLILWVETFNLDVPHGTPEELSDGIAMSKVLHQIAPDYFNESWLGKIKSEDVTNWRLKVSNLKKILKGILEYNLEVLGIQIHDFQMPDVNAIGEHADHGELGRLLQLILGCAVNCSEKQEYIQRIMAMEESVQHAVMTAIQELMTKEMSTDTDSEVGEQLKRTIEELNSAIEAKEELMQRCHELDHQVAALLEEKQNISLENEKLLERLNQAENLDDPSTPAGKRFQALQHQLDQSQEENYKLESAKDDLRLKVDLLEKDVNDLKERNTELHTLADESRSLKDELDVLRHTAEQLVKYEAQIESYKKKMEELSDLRGQVKLLEDKNTKYMQENLEIQEEVRKSSSMKQQLEVYKRQVHELQGKMTEETKRADKSEFETRRMQEKFTTLQREKERIVTERDSLREMNEELKCTEQLQHLGSSASEELSTSPGLEMLSLPPAVKEKMLRLEHENKMLMLKSSGDSDEQTQVLQTMLDDANARKNELETDVRLSNQKNMELEAQIEDLQEMAKSTVSNSEMLELRKKLDEQVALTQQKDKIVHKERENVSELQTQLSSRNEEVEKLRDEIEKKEEDKRVMGEKYKKYFDKARTVISTQEQKLKSSGNYYPDVQALKQQVQEKDRYIEQLLKDQEKNKTTFEQEEKMMVSAWYNLGIQLNRQAAIDRLENSQGQAFLSKQRQVHLHGQQRIPNAHTNSSSLHPSVSANNSSSGDGCFTSLFDCFLMKLRDDMQAHYYGETTADPGHQLSASAIQANLLAGLLGQDMDKNADRDDNEHNEKCNIDSTFGKNDNKNEGSLSPPKTHPKEPGLNETPVKYVKTWEGNKVARLFFPKIVPETPDFEQVLYNRMEINSSKTPLLDVSLTDTKEPVNCDLNLSKDILISDRSITSFLDLSDDGDQLNRYCEKGNVASDVKGMDNSKTEMLLDSKPDKESRYKSNDFIKVANESFFRKLDEYEDMIGNGLHDSVISTAEIDEVFTAVETTRNESHLSTVIGSFHDLVHTPARATTNLPVHEQSPFISKIPTDRVTKRRSRRKRKHAIDGTSKESQSDLVPGQEVCDSTSSFSSIASCHVDSKILAADIETSSRPSCNAQYQKQSNIS